MKTENEKSSRMILTDLEGDFDNPGAQDKFSFFIAKFSKFLFFALAIIDCTFIVIVLLFVLVLVIFLFNMSIM